MSTGTLAHLMICTGPACSDHVSRDGNGKPPINARGLVARWKAHRLYRSIHLTLTGCLGQCKRANQAVLLTSAATIYIERIEHDADADQLVNWGLACAEAGELLPLPPSLADKRYDRLVECPSTINETLLTQP
jgi:cobaltochelatase CobN